LFSGSRKGTRDRYAPNRKTKVRVIKTAKSSTARGTWTDIARLSWGKKGRMRFYLNPCPADARSQGGGHNGP